MQVGDLVRVLVADLELALRRHLLEAVRLVVLGRERRALRVGRQLHVGVLGAKVVRHFVGDGDVVGAALDEVARELDVLDEVLVRVVVVVGLHRGREVAKLEGLHAKGSERQREKKHAYKAEPAEPSDGKRGATKAREGART